MKLCRVFLAILLPSSVFAATVTVSGGITVNGVAQPLLFTWNSAMTVIGSGWNAGESVTIVLHGPLNSPGVAPADLTLSTLLSDAQGGFAGTAIVPYDRRVIGPSARIPRPGLYEVRATAASSESVAAAEQINLCPATHKPDNPFDWGHERGGRDGVLPGAFRQFSPERADPEWPTAWDERPVEIYGTVAPAGDDGGDQPVRISPVDAPPTHYGHDTTFLLQPDSAYQWLIGTSNYYTGDTESDAEIGRLEVEWETLNGGSTATYGQGSIGLPLWMNPL